MPRKPSIQTSEIAYEDAVVGAAVRQRRLVLGMTQDELAHAVDVTFQQIQKYENGKNRISVSRLCQIAKALDVSPAEFFKLPELTAKRTKSVLTLPDDCLALSQAYLKISDPDLRRKAIAIVRALGDV